MEWLGDAIGAIGSGIGSLLSWLFSGVISVVSRVIRAVGGIFDLLDAVFNFFFGLKDTALNLLGVLFPWIPADVMGVISKGLMAILLAGIIRKVRGK